MFEVSKIPGNLEIKKRTVTISAGSDTQVYRNEAIVVSGYTTSNLAPNQTLSGMSAYRSEKNVGNYDVVLLGTPVVMDATQNDVTENYVFIKNDGKLIITPAQIALSIKAKGDKKSITAACRLSRATM